ncbi:glycoside hydrolase family 31 protein [Clostridium sp. SYSU_GA19001]|uniref:glycoside hydrolase family 31 protein n=1 Tax=Clostridium caldaquaticum TaxID=2940653 RepID=UPI002077728A|nr:glycoside hydrolase family 31 protein [Clostridium caldaquaticum]MCM8709843.1 glycoside hydrolase family 31 protein [Clostridium caldaquaticum]
MDKNISEKYKILLQPIAHEEAIVKGDKYRFTVLTSRMIRVEYDEEGIFENNATQSVINRNFPVPEYRLIDGEDCLEIITSDIHLIYYKKRGKFAKNNLSIQVTSISRGWGATWHFGEETNDLKGTARTLDEANGAIPLERGLLSKFGFSIIDDSKSLLITEDGWVEPRKESIIDIYFLGYGRDFLGCLKDFYHLCGSTPLLPRFVFGNWWSRYYRYSEVEYKELMERFERENIPFSVAVIDMDWHLVDIDSKYGSGWTGYTWNRELFPDPKKFMEWLHDKGLKVTLNVHPADGVRAYEEMYVEMAKELEVDYENEQKINFDIANPRFLDAYFKYLHHPNEENGVDFWWVDWQQGGVSKIPGLDPLWMLNHYHYLDSKRNGKRGLTFSRYAGIGSHRYPIGFSGDSIISWETLDFQPYFTANASNVGYGWWSHDIGGHMGGYKDDELAVRWLQFGVFSPINRLHSSCSPFNGKEPWRYNIIAEKVMKDYLRLRHKLVPYLYTMNYLSHKEGLPLMQPMYYHSPWEEDAYNVKNQYYYGTELIVCPITTKINNKINQAGVAAWLPKGIWFDFFTGRVYEGDRKINFYRTIDKIPVLAKAGAIVPLTGDSAVGNFVNNPEELEIHVFAGADGSFIMYEDDGISSEETNKGFAKTKMIIDWNKENQVTTFSIIKPEGNVEVLPEERKYKLVFIGFKIKNKPDVFCNGEKIKADIFIEEEKNKIVIKLHDVNINTEVKVLFKEATIRGNNYEKEIFDFLNKAQISFDLKGQIYSAVKKYKNTPKLMSELQVLNLETELLEAVSEIIWAYCE